MNTKHIVVDENKCTGCRTCEFACSYRQKGCFFHGYSLIRIENQHEGDGLFSPVLCRHCEDPPCQEVCPEDAILQDPGTGLVRIDGQRCIGCGLCVDACPWAVPRIDTGEETIGLCNLCGGEPLCVKLCTPGALAFQ